MPLILLDLRGILTRCRVFFPQRLSPLRVGFMHLDNRIIASVDTLKRPARIKRLLEAPRWDLVVFGEAHHLSCPFGKRAYRKDTMLQDHARQACYLLHLSAPWFHVSSKPP